MKMTVLGETPHLAWIVLRPSGEGEDSAEFMIFGAVLYFEGVLLHSKTQDPHRASLAAGLLDDAQVVGALGDGRVKLVVVSDGHQSFEVLLCL